MLKLFLQLLLSVFRTRHSLALENLALRHQIEVLQRNSSRPHLRWRDRGFWYLLCCLWSDWRQSLVGCTSYPWRTAGTWDRGRSGHGVEVPCQTEAVPPSQLWRTFLANHAKDIVWNGRDNNGRPVASGTFFYRLATGDFHLMKKMTLVK